MPRHMTLVAVCLCLTILIGNADDGHAQATVIEATADFYFDSFHMIMDRNHCSWDSWSHAAEDGPAYEANITTVADPTCLDYDWYLHAGDDGLRYLGGWTQVVPEDFWWGLLNIDATLSCVLHVETPVLLSADRSVAWSAPTLANEHAVLLTDPDGVTESLFGDDPAVAAAQRTLVPGDWRVTILVGARQYEPPVAWYDASVLVSWVTTVDARQRSWGAVKARYR